MDGRRAQRSYLLLLRSGSTPEGKGDHPVHARNFDEILFDDWGFTNCKTDGATAAKGTQSWSQYRLALMDKIGRELVDAAKAVNPKVKVIIKYPRGMTISKRQASTWRRSRSTSMVIYTGTETRDPVNKPMQIQQYHGYSISRYLSKLNHNNRGGWVDAGGSDLPDRYAEQLWITLFAKLPEITLWLYIPSTSLPCAPTERPD